MLIFSAALAILASTGDAAPNQPAAPSTVAAAPAKDENTQDKIICRRMQATGTRLGVTKVCRTSEQWKQMNNNAREATESIQTKGLQFQGRSGG